VARVFQPNVFQSNVFQVGDGSLVAAVAGGGDERRKRKKKPKAVAKPKKAKVQAPAPPIKAPDLPLFDRDLPPAFLPGRPAPEMPGWVGRQQAEARDIRDAMTILMHLAQEDLAEAATSER